MRSNLCKAQYLLFALLMFVLSACGTTQTASTAGSGNAPAKLTANVILPKTAGKTVAAVADIASIRLKVTGATIPAASKEFAGNTGGTLEVYPGRHLTVTAQALDASKAVIYEGFATDVTVDAGIPATVSIQASPVIIKATDAPCLSCHDTTKDVNGENLVSNYKQSAHYTNESPMAPKNGSTVPGCAGCHGTQHNDLNPGASGRCAECHTGFPTPNHSVYFAQVPNNCAACHATHNFTLAAKGCIGCHSIPQKAGAGFVQDNNNGVRLITEEFTKWSHHVTGVALNNAHCAACHLEGKFSGGKIVVDPAYHMDDNQTHLRNADDDTDLAWDPANPNHTAMDTFCMSCHDANGASSTGSLAIQTYINNEGINAPGKTASPANPFGDTISNRYDKMQRPAVVNVFSQFDPANNSHHGVRGAKYTGRTRSAGARQIANPAAFNVNSSATLWGKRSTIYDSVNSINGVIETTNRAFNDLYIPLGTEGKAAGQDLGDDSTLHCGDCHTVGQWKPRATTNAKGELNTVAIGAHGSNNEYLLRNSIGSDDRHMQDAYVKDSVTGIVTLQNPKAPFLVCFNCHSYSRYGSVYNMTGTTGPHAGEYDAGGRCNGVGNTLPFNGYTTGKATDGTQFETRLEGTLTVNAASPAFAPGFPLNSAFKPAAGEQNPDFNNIFGISCLNCHNSGVGNGYGGIHGSANNSPGTASTYNVGGYLNPDVSVTGGAYVDGMGNTNKVQRFLPGLGNVMHVPGTLGGFTGGTVAGPITNSTSVYTFVTGGISNDTNWEQVAWTQATVPGSAAPTGAARAGAGCYTLNEEGMGGSLDKPASASYNIKGQSVDGGNTTPNAFGTWGGCADHTGSVVGGGDHGFIKRINRPVTY